MRIHNTKFSLDCLGSGILLFMLSMGSGEDASAQFIEGPADTAPGISGVSPLTDTPAASKSRMSLESYTLDPETATHWKLPRELEEISGLAMTGDNRLLAHNDERAIIYEIDYRNGSIVKAFQLSDTKGQLALCRWSIDNKQLEKDRQTVAVGDTLESSKSSELSTNAT